MYERAATILRQEAGCTWDTGGCMTLAAALVAAAAGAGKDAHIEYLLDGEGTVQHCVACINGSLLDADGSWRLEWLLEEWENRAGVVEISDEDADGTAPPVYDETYAALMREIK